MALKSARRIKVVHVVVAGQIGGAERFLVNLASRPEASGADHCLALMTPNPRLRAFFADAGLNIRDRGPVHENPLAYLWRSFGPADLAWLCRVLQEEKADLIHAHTFGSHILAVRAGLRSGLPIVRTEHGVRHYHDPSCALFRHWALRNTSRVAAVSSFVARTVGTIAPDACAKTTVVLNGIDLARFQPAPPPAAGPFTVVTVCRLEPVKRIAVAIEAVAQLPEIRFDIVGDGVERPMLEALVRARGIAPRVRFLGHQADPRPAIAAAQAFINSTKEEGLPLAVLEAAAMQRPAIGFASGGVPEIVHDGHTGWLAPEDTVTSLAAALKRAAADPSQVEQFGRNARLLAEAKFGLDSMCEGYGAVYRDLLQRHSAQAADAWSIV